MGLFDWILGKQQGPSNVRVAVDKIWMSSDEKYRGIFDLVNVRDRSDSITVVVVHFKSTLVRLEKEFEDRLAYQFVDSASRWNDLFKPDSSPERLPACLMLSSTLADLECPQTPVVAAQAKFVVAERHLLRARDEDIEKSVGRLPFPCDLGFCLSLDDCLLTIFASEGVKSILRDGSEPGKCLESAMVSNSIKKAQQRIAKKAVAERGAESPEEWLRLNCTL